MTEGECSGTALEDKANGQERAARRLSDDPGNASVIRLLNTFLRHRKLALSVCLGVTMLFLGIALLRPRTYTTLASFVPQEDSSPNSALSNLAIQLGLSIPAGGEAAHTPEFYADLLKSAELLRAAVLTQYAIAHSISEEGTADLVEILGARGRTLDSRRERAVEDLRDMLSVRTDRTTSLVEFSVTARSQVLSLELAERLLELVNEFNLETRQTRAGSERSFIEGRLGETEARLTAAEEELQDFLGENRRFENSPELMFERDRLQRRVDLQQRLFTSLSEALEDARISEVRNTPVITLVERPIEPAMPDSRHIFFLTTLGLALGGLLAATSAVVAEFYWRAKEDDPEDFREFEKLWGMMRSEIKSSWSRIGRHPSRRRGRDNTSG